MSRFPWQGDLIRVLRELDCARAAEHSFLDYHARGLDYVCLFRSELVTLKAYVAGHRTLMATEMVVAPHTHRYRFDQYVLAGQITHSTFKRRWFIGRQWREYEYRAGTKEVIPGDRIRLVRTDSYLMSGDSYVSTIGDIHTLGFPSSISPTVLITVQYQDEGASSSLYLAPGAAPPKFDGLYTKPTAARVAELRSLILDALNVGPSGLAEKELRK